MSRLRYTGPTGEEASISQMSFSWNDHRSIRRKLWSPSAHNLSSLSREFLSQSSASSFAIMHTHSPGNLRTSSDNEKSMTSWYYIPYSYHIQSDIRFWEKTKNRGIARLFFRAAIAESIVFAFGKPGNFFSLPTYINLARMQGASM